MKEVLNDSQFEEEEVTDTRLFSVRKLLLVKLIRKLFEKITNKKKKNNPKYTTKEEKKNKVRTKEES